MKLYFYSETWSSAVEADATLPTVVKVRHPSFADVSLSHREPRAGPSPLRVQCHAAKRIPSARHLMFVSWNEDICFLDRIIFIVDDSAERQKHKGVVDTGLSFDRRIQGVDGLQWPGGQTTVYCCPSDDDSNGLSDYILINPFNITHIYVFFREWL